MSATTVRHSRPFLFERDTFTFANELIWEYRFAAGTGKMTTQRSNPPATYSHRCFVMVRAARQFFYHARFEPEQGSVEPEVYRRLVREVVSRSPRRASAESEKVAIPGYDCLRSFSQAREPLLKAEIGGPWRSYFARSHWRMVAPTVRSHQEKMAEQLRRSFPGRIAPIVHLYRFPRITINHGIVLYGLRETEAGLEFDAYDPNLPNDPMRLEYRRAERSFFFPRTKYWYGGALNVYEMYIGGLY